VLDDYQDVALKMTDWSVLPSDVQVQVFRAGMSVKRIAAGASVDEKTALFSGTARRAYRLA